ncbi:MAG TPA: RNA polymerase sigma factor [Candidatus Angelobacter sp.]|jgi:RNA polymerase sigma-70 factor (ECF subfamily)|nr:RNA polymerase sigma factor [Candidatus Angelobacter sp.]
MTETRTQEAEQAGHADFEAFYLLTARTLHGYLCRIAGDSATADEVLQETYIRMLNAPPMDELPRKAYLYKTATNLLRDRWRKQKREQKLWEMSEFTEHVHQNFNLPLDMASVFDRLSAQERAILWLAHVEEMSHKEISAILGVKEKSVRVMVFRAREKAKELLTQSGFRGPHE